MSLPVGVESYFTGYEDVLAQYHDWMQGLEGLDKSIFLLTGPSGQGKSSLIRKFELACLENKVPFSLIQCHPSMDEIQYLRQWVSGLRNSIRQTATLGDEALWRFAAPRWRLRKALLGILLDPSAEKLFQHVAKLIGDLLAVADTSSGPDVWWKAAGSGGTMFVQGLATAWLKRIEDRRQKEEGKRLFREFLHLLEDTMGGLVVLALDGVEKAQTREPWLAQLFKELPPNVVVVMGSQQEPNWEHDWTNWRDHTWIHRLQPLRSDEIASLVRAYSRARNITDPQADAVEWIAKASGGLPQRATFIVDLWAESGAPSFGKAVPKISDTLLEQFFSSSRSREVIDLVEAGAILRRFNRSVLREVTGDKDIDWRALKTSVSFMQQLLPDTDDSPAYSCLHDSVRWVISEWLRRNDGVLYRRLHQRAAAYWEGFGSPDDGISLGSYPDFLYHKVCENESAGIDLFLAKADELDQFARVSALGCLVDTLSDQVPLSARSRRWIRYYRARTLQLMGHQDEAEQQYSSLLSETPVDDVLRAFIKSDLSIVMQRAHRLSDESTRQTAKQYALDALQWSPPTWKTCRAAFRLVNLEQGRMNWESAFAYAHVGLQMLEQLPDSNRRNYELASFKRMEKELYGRMGNWPKMLKAQEEAHLLFGCPRPDNSMYERSLMNWAVANAWCGRYFEAERLLTQARDKIDSLEENKVPGLYWDLAVIQALQGRPEKANETLEIVQKLPEMQRMTPHGKLVLRAYSARVRMENGDLVGSRQVLEEVLKTRLDSFGNDATVPELYTWLGQIAEHQHRWNDAVGFYREALSLAEGRRYYHECCALVGLARACFSLDLIDESEAWISRALPLAFTYQYNDCAAGLYLTKAHIAWGKTPRAAEYHLALDHLKSAMVYGLRFNRFLLDGIVSDIHCALQPIRSITTRYSSELPGVESLKLLKDLLYWWAQGVNTVPASNLASLPVESHPDYRQPGATWVSQTMVGGSLVEEESLSRLREPGGDGGGIGVITRLEQAIGHLTGILPSEGGHSVTIPSA